MNPYTMIYMKAVLVYLPEELIARLKALDVTMSRFIRTATKEKIRKVEALNRLKKSSKAS